MMRSCFGALQRVAFMALSLTMVAHGDTAVDFLVTSDYYLPNDTSQHFVARIVNDKEIAIAREELNKTDEFRIIAGEIVKYPIDWNPGWSYHLQPETIIFGDYFIEVCDASATYVEEHLEYVGGAFLPNGNWCPWGTRVLEELQEIPNYVPSSGATTPMKSARGGSILLMTLVVSFWSFGKMIFWR